MRIVGGEFRGRVIKAPAGTDTRPTTDRVREAVFSALTSLAGGDLGGGSALDLFAGSGALGLEALSRGVAHATFVERDRHAVATLRTNVSALRVGRRSAIVIADSIVMARRGSLPGAPFSLLLLDPPYRLRFEEVADTVSSLIASGFLAQDALVVFEHRAGETGEWRGPLTLESRKRYGSTEVDIVRYERGAAPS